MSHIIGESRPSLTKFKSQLNSIDYQRIRDEHELLLSTFNDFISQKVMLSSISESYLDRLNNNNINNSDNNMMGNRSHFNLMINMEKIKNLINHNMNNDNKKVKPCACCKSLIDLNNKKPIANKPKNFSPDFYKAYSFLNYLLIIFLVIYLSTGFLSFQAISC